MSDVPLIVPISHSYDGWEPLEFHVETTFRHHTNSPQLVHGTIQKLQCAITSYSGVQFSLLKVQ